MNRNRQEKGITLIALVITIIVLIILLMRKIENIFYIIYSMEIKMYILNIKNHHIMKMKMIMLTLKI